MKEFFEQAMKALSTNLYYTSLFTSLCVPDICAALGDASGRTDGPRYQAWFDQNLPTYAPNFIGLDCWGYRCAMLHQGRASPHKGSYEAALR